MRTSLARTLLIAGLALGGATVAMTPHSADARVVVGFGFGLPLFAPAYPAPVYYPPAPVYYAPPPVYYAPPAAAQPAPQAAPAPTSGECHEYSSTQIIAGTPQQVFGTACRQSDGSWRIVD